MPSKNPLAVGYKKLYDCLQFLEHPVLRTVLIIVLVVYCSTLLPVVNVEVSKVLRIGVVKLLVVVVIVLFAMRDPVLAVLLAMALVISTCGSVEGMENQGDSDDEEHSTKVERMSNKSESEEAKSEEQLMQLKQEGKQHESFDNPSPDGPAGYNIRPNCVSGCADGAQRSPECTGVQTFTPELGAQGLNCPPGYGGKMAGSPW